MAVSKIKHSMRVKTATVSASSLSFASREGWYRANTDLARIFGDGTFVAVTVVSWSGTIGFAQLDSSGSALQIVTPISPTNTASWEVRALIV